MKDPLAFIPHPKPLLFRPTCQEFPDYFSLVLILTANLGSRQYYPINKVEVQRGEFTPLIPPSISLAGQGLEVLNF